MCASKINTEETHSMKFLTEIDAWKQATTRWKIGFVSLLLLPWALVAGVAPMEIMVALIGLLFLWESYVRRDWAWARTPFFRIALIAWVWLVLVVSPFALKPAESVALALPWIRYAILVMSLRYWLLRTPQAVFALTKSTTAVLLLCALDMGWQYVTGLSLTGHTMDHDMRLTGPFSRPLAGIFTAKLFVPVAAVGAVVFSRTGQDNFRARLIKTLLPVVGAVLVSLAFLSGGRVAFATSFAALMLILAAVARSSALLRKQAVLVAVLAVVVVATLLGTQDRAQSIVNKTEDQLSQYSTLTHLIVLKTGWEVGREHWLTGLGMHGFRQVAAQKFQSARGGIAFPESYLHAHNTYLEWFAEAGLVGLIACVAMVFVWLKEVIVTSMRSTRTEYVFPAAMLGCWLMNFFPFMTTMSYFNNWAGVLTWFSVAFVYSLPALKQAPIS